MFCGLGMLVSALLLLLTLLLFFSISKLSVAVVEIKVVTLINVCNPVTLLCQVVMNHTFISRMAKTHYDSSCSRVLSSNDYKMLNTCSCNNDKFDEIANWKILATATSLSREGVFDLHFATL